MAALSAAGLALSAYLGWHYLVGSSVIGCGGGSTCDEVLSSRWSAVAGKLPVSGLAAGAFLAMLLASFFIGSATDAPVRRLAWSAMLVLAGAVAGSALWFIIVQKWIIGGFCAYCMATHIIGLLLAALVVWRASIQSDNTGSSAVARPLRAIGRASVGLVLAGILAASQAALAPPAVYTSGEAPSELPATDLREGLLVGSPDAPHVVNLLFDYNCSHCQRMHFMLDEVIRRYNGTLAIVLRPTPLTRRCNPHVASDLEQFRDSCELARIALAVWVAKREAFASFDHWMFSLESGDRWRPRRLAAARAKAIELVGQANFDAALGDPWIDQYLQATIRIFGDTSANAVPILVFGSHWVTPRPNDADELVAILQESLGVPKP